MDTIKLFLSIKLNIDLLNKSLIKWNTTIKNFNKSEKHIIYICKYNNVRLTYIPKKYALILETSITKFLYGNNSKNFKLTDLNRLFDNLDYIVNLSTNQNITTVRNWILTRLDLVNNYYCKNEKDKLIYINLIKKLTLSRYKNKQDYITSVHKYNKSITFNIYSKYDQDKKSDIRVLRFEIQYKNPGLNNLKKSGLLLTKTFEEVIKDISTINSIFKKQLIKLGLNRRFLTKKQLSFLLRKLYKKKKLTERMFNNMYAYFIKQDHTISNSTLNKYKNILAAYNYSHITLDEKPQGTLNFFNFKLFSYSKHTSTITSIIQLLLKLLYNNANIINRTCIGTNYTYKPYENKYIDDG